MTLPGSDPPKRRRTGRGAWMAPSGPLGSRESVAGGPLAAARQRFRAFRVKPR